MLKRAYRLRKNSDFQKVYKLGKRFSTDDLTIHFLNSHLSHSQLGIVVSKKVSKKAVVRNSLRRRISALASSAYPNIKKPLRIIIVIRKDFTGLKHSDLQAEFDKLMKAITP